MRALLSTYSSRGDAEPMAELAVQVWGFSAADEGRDAPDVAGLTPIGV